MTYHKDALFAQLTKLDNAMQTADSVKTMEMYRQSINELDSTFLELRQDKTFLMGSSAVVKHAVGEDHKRTYEYDAGQSILQLKDATANLQAVYTATFLNDSTMVLKGSGQSAYLPTTTYRRVQ